MNRLNDTYLGAVPMHELIQAEELALRVGLDCAESIDSENYWEGFEINDKTLFMPRYPLYHSISFDELSVRDLIDGSKTITLGQYTYRVRLIKGIDAPSLTQRCTEVDVTINSEWNRLIRLLLIHMPDLDLVGNEDGIGKYTWCQERIKGEQSAIIRDATGWRYIVTHACADKTEYHGWRPVLELV